MVSNMKNAIIAQSGGPTVAINASLAGVLNYNIKNGIFENVILVMHFYLCGN